VVRKLGVAQVSLAGKRVFLRADLNVPLQDGTVTDDTRLRAVLPTIRHCLDAGAAVVLASHLGRPQGQRDARYSLAPVAARIGELLEMPVPLAPDCVGEAAETQARALQPGQVLLLENLRFHPEEEANDPEFARGLAALADCYVNDAFATAHRAQASIEAIARFLQPAASGLLMERELEALGRILESPARPLVAILGGAKVSDKLGLVEHLLGRVDALAIGGAMAFTFLRALGYGVGRSLVEPELIDTARRTLAESRRRGVPLALPVDAVVASGAAAGGGRIVGIRGIPAEEMGLDIGPGTIGQIGDLLRGARTVVWNGPLGVFEKLPFAAGTLEVARAVAASPAFSVVGGGDTVAAVHRAGVADRIGYISTAGGAFLEFLEGRTLPGVEALTTA
jgi:phosphoglycerate kinase